MTVSTPRELRAEVGGKQAVTSVQTLASALILAFKGYFLDSFLP